MNLGTSIDAFGLFADLPARVDRFTAEAIEAGLLTESEKDILLMAVRMLPFSEHIIVKCGSRGCVVASQRRDTSSNAGPASKTSAVVPRLDGQGSIAISVHPSAERLTANEIASVTGAGDTMVGVLSSRLARDHAIMLSEQKQRSLFQLAQAASRETLRSTLAVSPSLSALRHPGGRTAVA